MDTVKQQFEANVIQKLSKQEPSNRDLGEVLKLIVEKMWSEERLAQYITQVHNGLCAQCPRCVPDGGGKLSGKLIALISALVAAVVALAGAVCKMALGGAA